MANLSDPTPRNDSTPISTGSVLGPDDAPMSAADAAPYYGAGGPETDDSSNLFIGAMVHPGWQEA